MFELQVGKEEWKEGVSSRRIVEIELRVKMSVEKNT